MSHDPQYIMYYRVFFNTILNCFRKIVVCDSLTKYYKSFYHRLLLIEGSVVTLPVKVSKITFLHLGFDTTKTLHV